MDEDELRDELSDEGAQRLREAMSRVEEVVWAAREWREALIPGTGTAPQRNVKRLVEAVDGLEALD